jgi:hydrogenase nickel incorporation protein HypA/HybF
MHEYSLVQGLVDGVEREIRGRKGTVRRVRVRVGELAGVDPGLLAAAYETFRPQTVCAAAELELTRVPARWGCRVCGRPIASGERLQCCGAPARLVSGDDLVLEQLELEVP